MMCGGSDVEPNGFFTFGNTEDKGIVVVEAAALGGTAVSEDQGYRMRLDKTGKLVVVGQFVINETTLTSRVYQCSSRYPSIGFGIPDIDIYIREGTIFWWRASEEIESIRGCKR
jgi:hypothetical protein